MPVEVSSTKKRRDHTYDVAIVGAGVIGCSLAVALGKQGRSVLLLERDLSEPDRIVGELLQPGGVEALEKLGLRDCLEGIDAIPVHGYECIYFGERVNIPYPAKPDGTPRQGRAFHHGRFIMKLREAARNTANVTIVEATARDIIRNEATRQVLGLVVKRKGAADEEHFFASLTVSADGYASNFRKRCIDTKPQVRSTFVALELIDADMPAKYHGHVVMGNNPPVLLYQIGTHETRALVDMPTLPSAASGALKKHLENVVLPDMPPSIQPAFRKAIEANRFPSMPNSFLPATTNTTPGMILLGDAMNMRHPLTGGGMTVAFNDVVLVSELLSPANVPDLDEVEMVLEQMGAFHWQRKPMTSIINILAQALYSLFAADDSSLRVLQRGCFGYFQVGGSCIEGPASLLAGIIRQPFMLFYHFFAVAFYSIYIMFTSMNPLLWPKGIFDSFAVFWKACCVLFPYIYSEACQ